MMVSCLSLSLLFLTVTSIVSGQEQIKIGIYNEIPDLGDDSLGGYKSLIERGFNTPQHTVNAVVDKAQYNPYGDLEAYLTQDGFDMLEIDTASLTNLVAKDLIVPLTDINSNVFPAAIEASTIGGTLYAYPTLLGGNFLISLSPGTDRNCPLRITRNSYTAFHNAFTECQGSLLRQYPTYDRIFGGKMNNEGGFYLPDLYVDGYIDKHGPGTARQAVNQVLAGLVEQDICERLEWYIGMCTDKGGSSVNKCYQDFEGSYVRSSSSIYPDIRDAKTMFYFGFSENLARILKENPNLRASAALSVPLDSFSHVLQYTDGVVIGKKAWDEASNEKKQAMVAFLTYFTNPGLRTSIALGIDVGFRMRYLLQANQQVYDNIDISSDQIYVDLHWAIARGVALPVKTAEEMLRMQQVLSVQCLPSAAPKHIRARKVDLRPSGSKKGPTPTPPCRSKVKPTKPKRDSRRGARRNL